MEKKRIDLLDVKQALQDARFRETLGAAFEPQLTKYLNNPGCRCNQGLYRKVLREAKEQLLAYFPGRESVIDEKKEIAKLAQNHFSVINCKVDELEKRLQSLPPGRKQIAITRYEDQVTAVVNELDYVY